MWQFNKFMDQNNGLASWMDSEDKISTVFFFFSVVVVAVACHVAVSKLQTWWLQLPPGPIGLPVIGSLLSVDPQLHLYFASLAETYGPILSIRFGRQLQIVISSPSTAREVLRDHDAIFANRNPAITASILFYGGNDIVSGDLGPTWRMLRKVCLREMLGPAALDGSHEVRREEVAGMVRRIAGKEGKEVNVGEEVFGTTRNIITKIICGRRLEEGDGGVADDLRNLVGEVVALVGVPNISDLIPALRVFDLQGHEKKARILASKLDSVLETMISRKPLTDDEAQDFVLRLLEMEKNGIDGSKTTPFTRDHVKCLLLDILVGGTETTSNTVEFAMAEMLSNPRTMRKAQEEVDRAVIREINKGVDVDRHGSTQFPYLSAVVKETLRLHPILPFLVPHRPSQSCKVAGHLVPNGSRVFINVWAIHRDPSVWENPTEFRPERFLREPESSNWNEQDLVYIPFGAGRRTCVGVAMAERMVMQLLVALLQSFRWRFPEGVSEGDVHGTFQGTLKKASPLIAIPVNMLPS